MLVVGGTGELSHPMALKLAAKVPAAAKSAIIP